MLIFWWTIAGVVLVATLVDGIIRYRKTEKHAARPLSAQDRELCARIVDRGLGIPWICRRAVDSGQCPCLPCSLLQKARADVLFSDRVA